MNDYEKYKDRGLTGLANVGNSCYLNSLMQILSHTYELNKFLESDIFKEKINIKKIDSVMLIEWNKLREMMWSENCTVAPYGFIKAVQAIAMEKEQFLFCGNDQNDIHEFLLFLIDCFHNSLARQVNMEITGVKHNKKDELALKCYNMMKQMYSKEYSEILDLFSGIHISEINCLNTGKELSRTPEPYTVLHLSLDNDTKSLNDCLDKYCIKEELKDDNGWFNESTNKKMDVKKGIIFWNFPKILIIALKRWNYDGRKINTLIDIPVNNFNLFNYISGYNTESYIYDLYGICNHSGSSMGGHYTAYVKNANNKWYEYNDTMITEIDEDNLITTKSYCLFYRKKIN